MSLQDKLDAFKADFEGKKAPPEVVAVMHKATADLIASGQAERTLKAGARAPTFALPNAHGELVRSADLLAGGPLVLTFYRGIWCPYCNMDLQAIEAAAEEIRAFGASSGRDLAADRAEPSQVGARERAELSHTQRPR